MEKISTWWRNRGTNSSSTATKNIKVDEVEKKEVENEDTLQKQLKNPNYDTSKESTLLEIKRSEDLLQSYHQRLEKEKIERIEVEKQDVIIRKIYRKEEDVKDEAERKPLLEEKEEDNIEGWKNVDGDDDVFIEEKENELSPTATNENILPLD